MLEYSGYVLPCILDAIPGTGKSVTGAHIAYVFAMLNKVLNSPNHQCVLYCGPSNKSVDVVFGKQNTTMPMLSLLSPFLHFREVC